MYRYLPSGQMFLVWSNFEEGDLILMQDTALDVRSCLVLQSFLLLGNYNDAILCRTFILVCQYIYYASTFYYLVLERTPFPWVFFLLFFESRGFELYLPNFLFHGYLWFRQFQNAWVVLFYLLYGAISFSFLFSLLFIFVWVWGCLKCVWHEQFIVQLATLDARWATTSWKKVNGFSTVRDK